MASSNGASGAIFLSSSFRDGATKAPFVFPEEGKIEHPLVREFIQGRQARQTRECEMEREDPPQMTSTLRGTRFPPLLHGSRHRLQLVR